jgi:hypothetical protein
MAANKCCSAVVMEKDRVGGSHYHRCSERHLLEEKRPASPRKVTGRKLPHPISNPGELVA